ncbi:MAG: DNA-protecting protein DprA [Peptococcaceae bacterium]|nr:DNA-protecting protein DprA [Peptococcaceae bacterium]
MDDRIYWLGLQLILYGTGKRLWSLVNHFGSPRRVWEAPVRDLAEAPGFNAESANGFARMRSAVDPGRKATELERAGISFLCYNDPEYPGELRFIHNPPAALFIRGSHRLAGDPAVAVVGTRKPTPYGTLVAEKISSGLAAAGVTVVSGMARGIDSEAHKGALAVGGRTIAVLGCGPNVIYPPENRELFSRITE